MNSSALASLMWSKYHNFTGLDMCFEYFEPLQKHGLRFVHFCYDLLVLMYFYEMANGLQYCTVHSLVAGFRLLCTDMLGIETCSW